MLYIANSLFILLCIFGLKVGIVRVISNYRKYQEMKASFLNWPEPDDRDEYDCRFTLDACIICFSLLLLILAFL